MGVFMAAQRLQRDERYTVAIALEVFRNSTYTHHFRPSLHTTDWPVVMELDILKTSGNVSPLFNKAHFEVCVKQASAAP